MIKKNVNRKYLLLSFTLKYQETGGVYKVFILSLVLVNDTLLRTFFSSLFMSSINLKKIENSYLYINYILILIGILKLYIHLQFLGTLIKKKNENRKYLLLSF